MAVSTPPPRIEGSHSPPRSARLSVAASGKSVLRRVPAAWVVVAAAVVWSLMKLRAQTFPVSYLNDSSVHEQMVRFATLQMQSGHLPLTSWFPFLGLGSPQFLHYQSLPAMLTGLLGTVTGPNAAFRWSLYVLLSLWPVSVYLSSRLFGFSRWTAAAAAAMAPFVMSVTGVGYEPKAYAWIGYGVWAQLWASLTLPIAWGLSWRAIRDGRNFFGAALMVSLTIAMHFETGYLALLPLLIWPLVSARPLLIRFYRAGIVAGGAVLASAWVIVPLIDQRTWAAVNEVLRGTALTNGYRGSQVLSWFATGGLLDAGRLPVITVIAGVGLLVACVRWRQDERGRALIVALAVCLLLSLGRTTFGSLVDLLPGSGDIFFRRFMMGVQLAALLLAGVGAAWAGQMLLRQLRRVRPLHELIGPSAEAWRFVGVVVAVVGLVLVLSPAWTQVGSFDQRNAAAIRSQQAAERVQGVELDRLLAVVKRAGGGRVYAGMPSNWGPSFTVGAVPVFKYLESRDVDEVGYTLRTASLMTNPEYFFEERNPADYSLFGIRYLILPAGRPPPVRAELLGQAGPYALWRTGSSGYVNVGAVVGTLDADRSNLGARSIGLLRSPLGGEHAYLRVNFGGARTNAARLPAISQAPASGSVATERDDLEHGQVSAAVRMRTNGVAVLSASFDPGWSVTIDGHASRSEMIAPALVGVRVPAGVHRVVFRYVGFSDYPWLFAVSVGALLFLFLADHRRRTRASARLRAGHQPRSL